MIRISDISFSIQGKPLFQEASADIPSGHKVGIVGRNGTGKTTLFHLITGRLTLDAGQITLPKSARIGEVAQEAPASDDTLIDTVLQAHSELWSLMQEEKALASGRDHSAQDAERISQLHLRLSDLDAHSAPARAATLLAGLGFDPEAQKRPTKAFSGGWRMRVALAGVLFAAPDLLLLDEPTNYLDLEGVTWLQSYLKTYPHTVFIISHDRTLLNHSVGAILHLQDRQLTLYQGGYDQFDAMRREKLAQNAALAKKQAEKRAHMQSFVDRFRYKASKAKQAQSRLKMLEKMQPIASDALGAVSGFSFPDPEELSPPILKLDNISVGYGKDIILSGLDLRIDQDDRIALLGANGQGKSTLSKLIAGKLAPTNGQLLASSKLRVGYFAQHQVDELELDETPLQHIQRALPDLLPAKARARLAQGGLGAEQADTAVRALSGGQKARLSMLLASLDAPHLLILDEPTNHLDIESREALSLALAAYRGAVILVSHDPHLVSAVADRLWLVQDGTVRPYEDDIATYQAALLAARGLRTAKPKPSGPTAPKRATAAQIRQRLAPLEADLRKCEDRVEKLTDMLSRLDAKLADADFYITQSGPEIEKFNAKRGEILAAIDKAEALWLDAQDRLDKAKTA